MNVNIKFQSILEEQIGIRNEVLYPLNERYSNMI